jgi:hypothetical protein
MIAKDLATLLSDDHVALSRLCTELDLDHGSPENRKELADHLIAALVRHEVAEEPHRDRDPDLAEAETLMRQLEDIGPQESRFERLLAALVRAVRRHLRDRGPAVVVRLRTRYPTARLRELGDAVLGSRRAARYLPHPALLDRWPATALLRPGRGFVDRARSALDDHVSVAAG